MRGQANLPALAVALLILTAVTGISLTVADGAFSSADRTPEQRRLAVALSERLVNPDGSLTTRANVLNESALDQLDEATLTETYPFVDDAAVRIRVDGHEIVERGSATGGTTIRRLVLVADHQAVTITPSLSTTNATITLPRRSPRAIAHLDPPPATTVTTVRANDRVVLQNSSGLEGDFSISLSRFETTRIELAASGPLPPGRVALTYFPANATKAVMEVTVRV